MSNSVVLQWTRYIDGPNAGCTYMDKYGQDLVKLSYLKDVSSFLQEAYGSQASERSLVMTSAVFERF